MLAKEAFQTNNIVLFDNIVIGQESIQFTFKWDDSVFNKVLDSLKLYKNGELVNELNTDAVSVSELLTASEYVLIAEYQDLGQPATISLTFATLEKGVPGIFITSTNATQTDINFEITESDTDNVGAIAKIELIHNNGTIEAENVDVRNFTNLLSGNSYILRVTYVYDLNDGNGEQTIVREKEVTTVAKTIPQVSIIDANKTQTDVSFDVFENDIDNVGAIASIELIHANGTIVAENADVRSFADLLSGNNYTIRVTYAYDLNDGNGEQTIVVNKVITTLKKSIPSISIDNVTSTQLDIYFGITETDIDGIGEITKIELVHENGTVEADNVEVRSFINLLSGNTYTVKVTYTYDLNDGNGEQTVTEQRTIKTNAKTAPQVGIVNEKTTSTSINADCEIIDVDYVIRSCVIELYNGETLVAQSEDGTITFVGLELYVDYTVKIIYTYDLNDGNGVQTSVYSKTIQTASSGLSYVTNEYGSCTITGIGTCTDTDICIPSQINGFTVTAIADNAFKDCTSITSIVIANGINTIGKRAFAGCTALTECSVPESVWEIGMQAFQNCDNLKTLYYNSGYSSYENSFLSNVKNLETIVFGGNYVPYYFATNSTSLKTVIILDGVTTVGYNAFDGCTNLTSVTMADSVICIESGAFANTALTTIILSQKLERIDGYAFADCRSLTSITIPDSVTQIGDAAFANTALTTVTLPSDLMEISASAFNNCSNLTIYCEAESKPREWSSQWNNSSRPVTWGYKSN
jgi:hypothetical protein